MSYFEIFIKSFSDYWTYLINDISSPSLNSYFYWLIIISIFTYALELIFPWRKNQPKVRKDFYLDIFYMFFNFFLFSLIGFNAASNIFSSFFNDVINNLGYTNLFSNRINNFSIPVQLLIYFLIRDFIQFNIHRVLHRFNFLWEFHKVHHSTKEMGFAAHLRYHWLENVFYKSIQYIPLGILGLGLDGFMIIHLVALTIGHLNHANIYLPLGSLKYLLNNPQMHIWHHAKEVDSKYGVNFGISLSIWDYIFNTNYIPKNGRDIELGFENDESYQGGFIKHSLNPFLKK